MRKLSVLLAASSLAALTACSAGQPPSSDHSTAAVSSSSPIADAIDRAMDKASAKLATRNIDISNNRDNAPKAEITPQGDFLIARKPIPLTPEQRREMLAYREQLIEIARQGIAIGKQGAAVGIQAASVAIAGAFSGKSDQQIEQSVKAQTTGIREAAAKICDRLPAMMTEQQKLAAVLPEFKPYATMTQDDISDCRHDALNDDDSDSDRTRATVRERIRSGIRSGIQTTAQATGLAASSTSGAGTKAANSSSTQN